MHLRIYNIPGIFRKNDGFFEIIGENLMIFQLFFNKYSEIQDKELYKKKFEEFFDALVQANSKKIYEMIGLNIKESDLIKKKHGLESLMDIFGTENIKSFYSEVKIGVGTTLGALLLGGTSISIISGKIATFGMVGAVSAVVLISAYYFYKYKEKTHNENVKNNFNKIHDFFDKVQSFLSEGKEYFCEGGDKNLFVIAYEKNEDNTVKELCMFPYYIGGLSGSSCPTIGNNAVPNSNADYYSTILEACKYYVNEFSERINLHCYGQRQPNLQNEIEHEFNFLKNATLYQIKEKINTYNDVQKFYIANKVENEYEKINKAKTANVSRNMSFNTNYQVQVEKEYEQEQNEILINPE